MWLMHTHRESLKKPNITFVKSSTEEDVPKKELSMPLDCHPLFAVLRAYLLIGKQDPASWGA